MTEAIITTAATLVGAGASLLCAWIAHRTSRSDRRPISGWRVSRRVRDKMRPAELIVKLPSGDAWVSPDTDVKQLRQRHRPDNMSEQEWHQLLSAVAARDRRNRKSDVPDWALRLLGGNDADRYRKEWGAHLYELIEAGELKQARRDRRRLALATITLALALRVRRALGRAR